MLLYMHSYFEMKQLKVSTCLAVFSQTSTEATDDCIE